ncbi:MAG TPA: monooxygenase, partial [Porticoccaceae bacterium]|nr:monooxygenase [Porticoccaceae bacterium]HCO60689.1 monooxygenase [Porticoccaceae bacterium]
MRNTTHPSIDLSELDFDPNALRAKYREERDKRLRPEGASQYQEVTGDFSHYIDDPYIEEKIVREPLNDEVEVIIVGGGFGGLLAGARLREAGINDIRVIEKGGDFGGTWYW